MNIITSRQERICTLHGLDDNGKPVLVKPKVARAVQQSLQRIARLKIGPRYSTMTA